MGKAERTKQHIIEQAGPLFNKKGVAGTSIDDILTAAKVAKGCLYGHFENKDEIANQSVEHLLNRLEIKVALKVGAEKTALDKLLIFLDIYKDPINALPEGGCPILNFAVESDDTNPGIKAKVSTILNKTINNLTAIINKGIEDKEFRDDFNAPDFALKMFTLIEGSIMISRVTNSNRNMITIINLLKEEIKSYQTA